MGRKKRSAPSEEQFAFPRGGGSEVSQKDVEKLEDEIEKRFNDEQGNRNKRPKKKGRRERKDVHNAVEETIVSQAMGKRLSRKIASVGMKFWGMVMDIGSVNLGISLPNGLDGRVHASEASDVHLEAYAAFEGKGKNRQSWHWYPPDMPPLASLFFVGQFVRCTVIANWEPTQASMTRDPSAPVALSLVVAKLHEGLVSKSLREGMLIAGCIKSVEDHGYTVTLGLGGKNSGTDGFLPQPASQSRPPLSLSPGMMMEFCIQKLLPNGSAMLSCDAEKLVEIVHEADPECPSAVILPGMMVNATVESILPSGLGLSFLEHSGHVGLNHLIQDMPSDDWRSNYAVKQTLRGRVIHINPATNDVGLSLKPHLLQFAMPMLPPIVGQTFDNARVVRVEQGVGVVIEIPNETMRSPGFVDAHMLDDDVAKLEAEQLVGKKLTVRVTGFRPMEGMLMACAKAEVLESEIFGLEDVLPGMLVKGLVTEVKEKGSLIVKLAEGIRGSVPKYHRGALNKDKPMKPGMEVNCRVLSVDIDKRDLLLTTNPRLVTSDLPVIVDASDLEIGKRTLGWSLGKWYSDGMMVQFYGKQAAYLPYKELGVQGREQALSQYPRGETIKVYIAKMNQKRKKVTLTLSKPPPMDQKRGRAAGSEPEPNGRAVPGIELQPCEGGQLWPGDIVKGRVQKSFAAPGGIPAYVVTVSSKERGVKGEAILHQPHLSDSKVGCDVLSKAVGKGTALGRLMVLQLEPQLIVTRKPSLVSKADVLPSEFSDIRKSMVIQGYVSKIKESSICVQFLNGLRGKVNNYQFPVPTMPARDQFYVGQSARAQVLKVFPASQTFTLTMKKSWTGSTDTVYLQDTLADVHFAQKVLAKQQPDDPIWSSWPKELTPGRLTVVVLREQASDGWKCCCKHHKEIEGILDQAHTPSKPELTAGSEIKVVILDVSPQRCLSLSAKPELLSKPTKKTMRVGSKLNVVVQAVGDIYAVVSIPSRQHEIAFIPSSDYNMQSSDSAFSVGQAVEGLVTVLACNGTGGRTLLYVPLFQQVVKKSVKAKDKPKAGEQQNGKDELKAKEKMTATVGASKKGSDQQSLVAGGTRVVETDSELEEVTSEEEEEGEGGSEVEATNEQPGLDAWGGLQLELEGAKEQVVSTKAKKRKSVEVAVANEEGDAKRKRMEEQREDRIREEEKRMLSGDQAPTTTSDFEKLVLEAPNSSYVWIQYITFLLSLGEVSKARAVAERALETINFREEQEKFNVWVAYLNLENMYGKVPEDAVTALFQRALPYNDPKKLHLALIDILDGSGRTEMCDASMKSTCRKFSGSAKVWLKAIELDVRNSRGGLAKKTLGRALKSLPTRKHIKVTSAVGLMEFKSGDVERGREVFEGLVVNYPKKLDLWNLYIDQEIRAGDIDRTKSLFERATHLALPPRKIKFLFKRYLQYVKDRGDVEGVDHVKRRAVEYVERMSKG